MTRKKAPKRRPVVFLFDIDNTLLNNDQVGADLRKRLEAEVGSAGCRAYWQIFEGLRRELGYADYLGALQRYRTRHPHDWQLLTVSRFMIEYPFANRLFPNSLDVIAHVQQWGPAVLLSDGDVVFQPRKAERSGLAEAVEGRVLIYTHKEQELNNVAACFPAAHYVMVDDKIRILAAMKKSWGARLTTIFVRQGHYALDAALVASYPAADLSVERIGDLLDFNLPSLAALEKWKK
ncbi:MAG TPA: HAD family hydrolase [Verrucomicrobiae bacterium]|jgi:FMN phosphatase YigB (HAD superfamily)|nr:HAD family hydrolase [Verrucomicrobiae bacterium]